MILETTINDVEVKFTGNREDIAYISKVFFGSVVAAQAIKKRVSIVKANAHTVFVNGFELSLDDEYITKESGTDYLICRDGSAFKLFENKEDSVLSSEIIGGFHYGSCGEEFEPINNIGKKHAKKLAGINAYSIWDQYHRPTCDPKGMVYIPKLDIWEDIYILSDQYEEVGTSAAGFNILAGYEHHGRKLPKDKTECKWQDFKEIGEKFGKRMLTEREFQVSMYGVKENCSAGVIDNGITKHIPDFMSRYGIEQATGCQWIWSSENYKDYEDRKKVFGGYRDYTSDSGSRASAWSNVVWGSSWAIGCRFACDPLHPAKMSGSESLEKFEDTKC